MNDADCDGVPTNEDCDDNDPFNTNSNVNDADCDGVPTSEDCDDNDPFNTNTNVNDADCDGVPTSEDCDDNDPFNTLGNTCGLGPVIVVPCDDGNPNTIGDMVTLLVCDNSVCVPCMGMPTDCSTGPAVSYTHLTLPTKA